mmetsp:Transcript_17029/g.54554  ORF Transcript_17029/g.54554 Transcript_17029/m.54554 type:complete len:230 (+) Transcript_17029:1601-2290(+)
MLGQDGDWPCNDALLRGEASASQPGSPAGDHTGRSASDSGGAAEHCQAPVASSRVSVSKLPAGTPGGTTRSKSLPSGVVRCNVSPGAQPAGTTKEMLIGPAAGSGSVPKRGRYGSDVVREAGPNDSGVALATGSTGSGSASGSSAVQLQAFDSGSCVSFRMLPGGTPGGTARSRSLPSGVVCWSTVPATAQSGTTTDIVTGSGAAAGSDEGSAVQLHWPVEGSCVRVSR